MQVTNGQEKKIKYTVQFEWTRTKSGARPTRLVIDGLGKTEVGSDLLRSLPIRELKAVDVQAIERIMKNAKEGIDLLNAMQSHSFFPQGKNPAAVVDKSLNRPRKLGGRIPDEEYEQVARLYLEKTALGYSNISMAIARELFCAPSTVRKRIIECRKRKLLPQLATKGKK